MAVGNQVVLLATAQAFTVGPHHQVLSRVLCDPGSQVNFISEHLCNKLQLIRYKCSFTIEGIGSTAMAKATSMVKFTLRSIHDGFSIHMNAIVLPNITSTTPAVHVDIKQWSHLSKLQLADPQCGAPGYIDILIGAETWCDIVEGNIIRGGFQEPCAQYTKLGYVLFGPAHTGKGNNSDNLASFHIKVDESKLEEVMQRFWQLEEATPTANVHDNCDSLFRNTHTRLESGRYEVQLLFKENSEALGGSYNSALQQFLRMEKRLINSPEIYEKYRGFMAEYEQLGHMEKVKSDSPHDGYYIPHHAVTTKFRVVFNASSRTTTGISLNDTQLVGPFIQDSLLNILFRFRRYQVALTADVEKMFRQIRVAKQHQDWQKILWRHSAGDQLQTYRLTTITYGMACSPYNAVRTLVQCASDNSHLAGIRAEQIQQVILDSFYVDDFLVSCDTTHEATEMVQDVTKVLQAGCLPLRKWCSNNNGLLEHIQSTQREDKVINTHISTVLGLHWNPSADELLYHIPKYQEDEWPTKRRVLSDIAQLFDPTGLLAPVVLTGKIFMQELWAASLDWDEPLPQELALKWLRFRRNLTILQDVRIPRWLGITKATKTILYGFCDASLRAYGAVIYVKSVDSCNNFTIRLLTARTRVGPKKGDTIPRLELRAAQLLALTLDNARKALQHQDMEYHLWSDSYIVLCWLRKSPSSLKPFVGNRVCEIQKLSSIQSWHHVSTDQNPADCASRGLTADKLLSHKLWWHGPKLIEDNMVNTNHTELKLNPEDLSTVQEEQKVTSLFVRKKLNLEISTRTSTGDIISLFVKISSWNKLLRTVAIIKRFSTGGRQYLGTKTIVASEISSAFNTVIRIVQQSSFSEEFYCLTNNLSLPLNSSLLSLDPFIDDCNLLRLGGRLQKSALQYSQRHPIILPGKHPIIRLLLNLVHKETLHGGPQLMLSTLRQRFWILQARTAVRTFIHNCITCRRHRGATVTQQMSSLPQVRVSASRPFSSSGLDYCGPFNLRIGKPRSRTTVKTYVAIFVCMATKAVHIEVVEDLSAMAFLDAFTRFVSRRGRCRYLYSDNATTFHGANRILSADLKEWHSQHNLQQLSDGGTTWQFISPGSPHQGGIWEAAVKSAKTHMYKVIGTQTLWFCQLQTLMTRIEACLNSRPLIPMYDTPDAIMALTPGHFLIGEALLAVP